jgi:hypothetical protein
VPSVTASAIPTPVTAKTPATMATPDWKLISSIRAFSTRLNLPVRSLTTKHDTGGSAVLPGSGGSEPPVAGFGQVARWNNDFGILA